MIMQNKVRIIIFLVYLFLITSCTNKNDLSKADLSIKILQKQSINIELNEIIYSDSCFYGIRKYDNSLICFDLRGKIIHEFGSSGDGPGEFSSYPVGLTLWKNFVITADATVFELELYDLEGAFYRSLDLTQQMISPVYNIVANPEKVFIEGLSLDLGNQTKIIKKVISIDKNYESFNELKLVSRNLDSFDKLMKNMNPFETDNIFFQLNEKEVGYVSDDTLNISEEKISLLTIPKTPIDQKIKNYYLDSPDIVSAKEQGIEISIEFPKFLPKVVNAFRINDKLFVLSYQQLILNDQNSDRNNIYVYNNNLKTFEETSFPLEIPINKVSTVIKNKILVLLDESVDAFEISYN